MKEYVVNGRTCRLAGGLGGDLCAMDRIPVLPIHPTAWPAPRAEPERNLDYRPTFSNSPIPQFHHAPMPASPHPRISAFHYSVIPPFPHSSILSRADPNGTDLRGCAEEKLPLYCERWQVWTSM